MSDKPCPFCGSMDIHYIGRSGAYDVEKIHCDGCKTEFYYYPTHIGRVWNRRTETDVDHCPFCGGEVEFDGIMNHSQCFSDAYCPTCGWRFEFQSSLLPRIADGERDAEKLKKWREKCVKKAMKAFARRAEISPTEVV